MSKLIASDALWKEGGGYYTEKPEDLRRNPLLPDTRRVRDQRILAMFETYGGLQRDSRVLEIGCGKSMWLPCLAREFGCSVSGIDIEPYAAELARANLAGAGMSGNILCRDAFNVGKNRDLLGTFDLIYSMGVMEHFEDASERLALLSNYLKPGGRLITTVPNLQGINWMLQRYASLERLHMHVVYDKKRLAAIHRRADLHVLAADYVGFYDGFVSAPDVSTAPTRRKLHERLCWATNMTAAAWLRASGARFAPELKWFAPHVFCAAQRLHS
jgi:2-polyprenyl-3-methyl-5-hydroxy-6-metoxy-1,4-benzoquinol methylase